MRLGDNFYWLGGHSANQEAPESGGQFTGLMDALHPSLMDFASTELNS